MKRIILTLLTILSIGSMQAQSVAEQSRELYDKGDYKLAIELLEKEMSDNKAEGKESSELYYNLANSYFRINEVAKARLYYERALLLDPSDRDIRHNIDYLTTKIEDKIPMANTFFISIWFAKLQGMLKSNNWAVVSVISFLLLMACLIVFFFTRQVNLKKTMFYIGIVLLTSTVFANVFAFNQKQNVEQRHTAVVMSASATVHSSPDRNSKEIFVLHGGTKVNVAKEDRSWLEIELDDGSVGWIQRENIEII